MSLQYLSGIGKPKAARQAAKAARVEKRTEKKAVRVEKKAAKKLSPVVKSKVNKLQVQQKIRKTFAKKAEPVSVEVEEIEKEQAEPAEYQAEETETQNEETANADTTGEEMAEENAEIGVFYPMNKKRNYKKQICVEKLGMYYPMEIAGIGKPKFKIKKPKLKGKLKAGLKKLKDDKHTPAQKAAHFAAKSAFVIPRSAFIAILKLGKALEKTPIKINLSKKIAQKWNTEGKKISEVWYKFGGDINILREAIEKASSTKLNGSMGEVVAAAAATTAAASPIIVAIMKILKMGGKFVKENPALLAKGQAIAKQGIDKLAANTTAQQKTALIDAGDAITKQLPPDTQRKVNNIRKLIPKASTNKTTKLVNTEIKDIKVKTGEPITTTETEATPTSKNNNMILIGGAAALIGAYFIFKKK